MTLHYGLRRLASFLASLLLVPTTFAQTITIDASQIIGTIHRLNDVDNGPLCQHGIIDLAPYYKQLDIRNVRLHDVTWSYGDVLDINFLFPNWDADPDLTASYNFLPTDDYIKSITDLGINIIFRLGSSAEGKNATRHNVPPPSEEKWVAVVEHIVRHYNQGWNNGLHSNIRYWEIWNEPDLPDFWSGTPQQYYRLYDATARALKHLDPSLRVGGPALAGNQAFLEGFLAYARQRFLPLDFLSWHVYTQNPAEVVKRAEQYHEALHRYGFTDTQSILDEWNYGPANWRALFHDPTATRDYFDATQSSVGAAFDAAVLIGLQEAPVDIATFYTGTTAMWGMFTAAGVPQKPYYAFLAFSELLKSPKRLKATISENRPIYAIAGLSADGESIRVLISNPSNESHHVRFNIVNLPWQGPGVRQRQIVNEQFNFELLGPPSRLTNSSFEEAVPSHSVVLLTLHSQREN